MNILKKNVLTASLFIGIGLWNVANAQDPDSQLNQLEARIDAKLNQKGNSFQTYPPTSSSTFIRSASQPQSGSSASSSYRSRILIINNPGGNGVCRFYIFRYTKAIEELLKGIAKNHWELNDVNDSYDRLKAAGRVEQAGVVLKESARLRNLQHKQFFELLKEHCLYNSKMVKKRQGFRSMKDEFTGFIIETAEKGKYVRAWVFHGKGGMEVTLSGRDVIINRQQ